MIAATTGMNTSIITEKLSANARPNDSPLSSASFRHAASNRARATRAHVLVEAAAPIAVVVDVMLKPSVFGRSIAARAVPCRRPRAGRASGPRRLTRGDSSVD